MTDGDEVEGPFEVAAAEDEVARRDRGDETVIEGLRDAQSPVQAIPAELDGDFVDPQLASVKEAEDLDPGEAGLEQLAVLLDGVLAQVPGVVGLLGARGREGEAVRGGDVGDRGRLGEAAQ